MQFTDKIPSYKYDQFIGIIWGTENPEEFSTLTGKLPVFLFPLGSRCILSYQLAFLGRRLWMFEVEREVWPLSANSLVSPLFFSSFAPPEPLLLFTAAL